MKKFLKLATLFLVLSVLALTACSSDPEPEVYEPEVVEAETTPTPSPEPEDTPDDVEDEDYEEETPAESSNIHGAIHRVEYGNNVAYLFGTLHGGHPHWFPLAEVVEDALRRSDVLVIEIDDLAGDIADMESAVLDIMFLPDGATWADILPDDAYEHLVEMMVAWEIPYEDVNNFNPSFLVFSLEMEIAQALAYLEVSLEASVDAYVSTIAEELGLSIIGLESIEQQLDILYNPPFEVMLAQVMNLLPPMELVEWFMESEELSLDELARLYENNDLAALTHAFSLEMGADADCLYAIYVRDIVMNWRSTYYANEIIRLLQQTEEPTTFFVAVGLSHIIRAGAGDEFTDIVEQLGLQGFVAVPVWE